MAIPLTPEEIAAAKAAVRDGASWQHGDELTDAAWQRFSCRDGAFEVLCSEDGRTWTLPMTEAQLVDRLQDAPPDVIRRMIEEHRRARGAGGPSND